MKIVEILLLPVLGIAQQGPTRLRVQVSADSRAVGGATVVAGTERAQTAANGEVIVTVAADRSTGS